MILIKALPSFGRVIWEGRDSNLLCLAIYSGVEEVEEAGYCVPSSDLSHRTFERQGKDIPLASWVNLRQRMRVGVLGSDSEGLIEAVCCVRHPFDGSGKIDGRLWVGDSTREAVNKDYDATPFGHNNPLEDQGNIEEAGDRVMMPPRMMRMMLLQNIFYHTMVVMEVISASMVPIFRPDQSDPMTDDMLLTQREG